jgi:hypothetical protein
VDGYEPYGSAVARAGCQRYAPGFSAALPSGFEDHPPRRDPGERASDWIERAPEDHREPPPPSIA